MPTREELAQALKGAHEAGDTAAAQKLAMAIQDMDAAPTSPFLQRGMDMVGKAQAGQSAPNAYLQSVESTVAGAVPTRDGQPIFRSYAQERVAQAAAAQAAAERKVRVEPVQREADAAGVAAGQDYKATAPFPDRTDRMMTQDFARQQVYDQGGVMSPSDADTANAFNSILFGVPGMVSQGWRDKLKQASEDQPGASLVGNVRGYLIPGEAAWQVGRAGYNTMVRPMVNALAPKGGSMAARATRLGQRGAEQFGGWTGANALYQGSVGESVAAAEEGRAPTLESALDRAEQGAKDPSNVLGPVGLISLNRIFTYARTGGRTSTPDWVAADVAGRTAGRSGDGSILNAQLLGGDIDKRAETILIRMLRDAGFSSDDIRGSFAAFEQAAQGQSDLPVLTARLKDVFIDKLGPRAEQVVQDFLQGAGVSKGGTAGQAVTDAADQDYGRLAQFLEDSANARLGSGSRYDTLTGAQQEMKRIGDEGYERVFASPASNAAAVDDLKSALDFFAGSELASPLRQIAAGKMLNVEQMIAQDPRKAAHWMQMAANTKAQEAFDAGNKVLGKAYTDMRDQILSRLEADGVAPGYQQARMQFGDEFGIEQAVTFGSRFFTKVTDTVGVRQLADDLRNLTPEQQEAALLSIRDELLRLAGRGRQGAAPRLSQLNTDSALGGLETVVGEKGGQLANDIRFIDERLARIRRTDPGQNSRTASNQEARDFANDAVSNPVARTVGKALNALGGDAAVHSAVGAASGGTSTAVLPIFSIRAGMRAMGDKMARGRQGKIDDVTSLLLRDVGPSPRPGMPGDDMAPLPTRGGGGSAGGFSEISSNGQMVQPPNALAPSASPVRAGGLVGRGDLSSAAVYGGIGGLTGNFQDINQDGQINWEDNVAGGLIGAGGAVGFNRLARPKPGVAPKPSAPPPSRMSPERAEKKAMASQSLGDLGRRPTDAEIEKAPWLDWRKDDTERFELEIRHLAEEAGKGADGEKLLERIYADAQAAALQAGQRLDDNLFAWDFAQRMREVVERMREGDLSDLRAIGDIKSNGLSLRGDLGNQAIAAGVGSVGGSANDLNDDGKKDWQDAALGALGGLGVVNAPRAVNALRGRTVGAQGDDVARTAGVGGGRKPPKPDSPEAIKAAVKDIAKPKKEPTRLEQMVEEGKDAAVPPVNTLPREADALGAQAERMSARGLGSIEIYDQTGVAMIPYNGGQVPVVSPAMGPEELTRVFYGWLKEPPAKRPEWVRDIIARAPRKKGLMLTDANKIDAPAQPNALAETPLPKAGFPGGAVALGAGAGAVTGIPAGILAGTMIAREQDRKRNALAE